MQFQHISYRIKDCHETAFLPADGNGIKAAADAFIKQQLACSEMPVHECALRALQLHRSGVVS